MKKFIIALLLCAPMTMFAQQKFGHMNSAEIIQSMPEFAKAQGEVAAKSKEFENEFGEMYQEFQRKVEEFQKNESTMNPTKKEEETAKLTEMQQKLQAASQDYQQKLQAFEQEQTAPLYTKLQNAIMAVGKAGNYVYIMDTAMGIPYISDTLSEDVTTKIKAELKK